MRSLKPVFCSTTRKEQKRFRVAGMGQFYTSDSGGARLSPDTYKI